jgi:hypothetical protein
MTSPKPKGQTAENERHQAAQGGVKPKTVGGRSGGEASGSGAGASRGQSGNAAKQGSGASSPNRTAKKG